MTRITTPSTLHHHLTNISLFTMKSLKAPPPLSISALLSNSRRKPNNFRSSRGLKIMVSSSCSRDYNSKPKLVMKPLVSTTGTSATESLFAPSLDQEVDERKFEWYAQWYPIAPICDLDKRVPHAKRVMGMDLVVWWDKNEDTWQVFEDRCPHRLAPLSEGRIDEWGRLQCVYHGWCFDGAGDCKFIPQAPRDGPQVHTSKKACAIAYPSIEQNKIIWFWPNSEPHYKDVATIIKPPQIPGLDDPSYSYVIGARDFPYGYEVLVENLMDPAHVPYAHYGILQLPDAKSSQADREGGVPIKMNVKKIDITGYDAKQEDDDIKFIAPSLLYIDASSMNLQEELPENVRQQLRLFIFLCIPVSPGNSRLIWSFPRNSESWIGRVIPRWILHLEQNLILDSDLNLLHLEERKLVEAGPSNWQKACFIPTKADALVVAFRKWLKKYAGGQVDWGTKMINPSLPPTPPKEQLLDRYRSHVVNCSSCRVANKGLKALEMGLKVISLLSVGMVGVFNSTIAKASMVCMALLCFAVSKRLSHFIYKSFYFHDYNHAIV